LLLIKSGTLRQELRESEASLLTIYGMYKLMYNRSMNTTKQSKYITYGFKGKKHTLETKLKIGLSKKKNPTKYWLGKKRPDMVGNSNGFKKGKASWNKGKKCSKETKEKVSIAVKKLWQDRKYRERMVEIHLLRTKES